MNFAQKPGKINYSNFKKNIFIVMPAYNAGKTIEKVFSRIPNSTNQIISHYIIVVDGASDNTLEKAKLIQKEYKKVTILLHPKNKGYGATQITGFNKALEMGADICVLLHSDGQYAPEIMEKLLEPLIKDEADIVTGSRMITINPFKTSMPLYKYVGNKTLTWLENKAYESNISEFHTGYMLYSKKVLESIKFNRLSHNFHFDGHMILLSLMHKFRIKEIPIPTIYADERSNLNAIKYGLNVLKTIWRYKTGYFKDF